MSDLVHGKSHRSPTGHHDHAGRFGRWGICQTQQLSQADHRQDAAAKVGNPQQAPRRQRHVGERGDADDLADTVEPESE